MMDTNYKAWLLSEGMTEGSAARYIRGIELFLRDMVAQGLLGEYDGNVDAVTLLGLYDRVGQDHKYIKKYMKFLCRKEQSCSCHFGAAAEQLLRAFEVRDQKAGRRSLLEAIHPNLEHYLSKADTERLQKDEQGEESVEHRALLRQAMEEEGARHRLAELLYQRACQVYENRTDTGLQSPLQALRLFAATAGRAWRRTLPETEAAVALSHLENTLFDLFEERETALFIADKVLQVLLGTPGASVSMHPTAPDSILLQTLQTAERLSAGKGLPPQVLSDVKIRRLMTEGYLYLSEQDGAPILTVAQGAGEHELSALWQEDEARECLGRIVARLSGEEIHLPTAVALFAAAPTERRQYTARGDLYSGLLRLICKKSLALRAKEEPQVRLEGCEHLKELFALCPYDTLQALSALLSADQQELLHRRDVYGNSLCFARLLEDMGNCAMKLAETEDRKYYLTYAALCFGRASAVAEGCGEKEFALRCAGGKLDALEQSAQIVTKSAYVQNEYLYDHGLPITAAEERIAALKGEWPLIDLQGMRAFRGGVITCKPCPDWIGESPVILKPRGVELGGFFNEYYVASLDSEVARRKKHTDADAQSIIMMMLLQGQRVILSANMIADNPRILELADEPAFLELMKRGYILLSFYGTFDSLIRFAITQMEGRFEWSSMPFLNYTDTDEDTEIASRRAAVAAFLRGETPVPALHDPTHQQIVALFKERLERFEESLPLAGLCYYYQRGQGAVTGVLRPRLQRFYRQQLTDPDFAAAKQVHGIIDAVLLRQQAEQKIVDYNRTSYKNCIDLIADGAAESLGLTGAESEILAMITDGQLEQVRDVLSDQHNYLLSRRISNFYHNDYRELWRVPPKESGVHSYQNVLHLRESGERVNWKLLLDVLTRMRSLILERPRAERLASQLSAGGQQFVIDAAGRLRVERAGLVLMSGQQVELTLSEESGATIHVETESEYER